MFKNHVKIAARNLWKHRSVSAINIIGLAVGLATCLLITLFVKDELSYDRYNTQADRIYRINVDILVNGTEFHDRATPAALGPALREDFPQVAQIVRIKREGNILVKKGNATLTEPDCFWADSTLFQVFTLPMVAGDPKTALTAPNSMVLSQSMAEKLFNSTDVIGRTLLINNTTLYKITGVIKDMPAQSHVHFSFIKSISGMEESRSDFWLNNNFGTYVLVRAGTDKKSIDGWLRQEVKKYVNPQLTRYAQSSLAEVEKKGGYFTYTAMPLTKIHLYSTLTNELEPSGNITYIYIFIVIALLILLVACVNFMNLSTASSMGRSKEVGIRKVLGSGRSSLIGQFLSESLLTSLISLVLAVLITATLLPYFNQLSGKQIPFPLFSSPGLLAILLFSAVLVGLLAGIYPSVFLSSFEPTRALKGKLALGNKGGWVKNSLVVFQFVTAILLIVGTLVIYGQLGYIQNKKLGYDRQHLLVLKNTYSLGTHARSFKQEVSQLPGVEAATMAGTFPTSRIYNKEVFSKSPTGNADQASILADWEVDADYIPALGMQMVKGRNFSAEMPTDSSAIIINQTAAQKLGFSDPLNQKLYLKNRHDEVYAVHIIGVVKDFNTGSVREKIEPVIFKLAANRSSMAFRIHTKDIPSLIGKIKATYLAMPGMAGQPFQYSFMDEDFNNLYQSEQRTGVLFIYFACFAIGIACLGLLGLVTFSVKQRTKEIGVRKVLGASVSGIVTLLSRDFLKLILIAIVIALPLGWWAMNQWLQGFAYRITIPWWIFPIAVGIAIGIALLTVSTQTIRAALTNPVKSLRSE